MASAYLKLEMKSEAANMYVSMILNHSCSISHHHHHHHPFQLMASLNQGLQYCPGNEDLLRTLQSIAPATMPSFNAGGNPTQGSASGGAGGAAGGLGGLGGLMGMLQNPEIQNMASQMANGQMSLSDLLQNPAIASA